MLCQAVRAPEVRAAYHRHADRCYSGGTRTTGTAALSNVAVSWAFTADLVDKD